MMSSKFILGTAQIGMDYGINNSKGKIPKTEAFDILNHAFQNGIQYLDTAPVYGEAHKIIGEFHKIHSSTKFNVITKIPAAYPIEKLEKLVDSFLVEMNIDTIDVLHFHSILDYRNTESDIISDIFNNLKLSQKVQSFGVSIYENSEFETIKRSIIDVIQLPFNLLDNSNLRGDLIAKLKQQNFKVHTRSVFLQGLFFSKTKKNESIEIQNSLTYIKEICRNNECDIEELALSYCINQKNIDKILVGIDSIEQLKKNITIERNRTKKDYLNLIDGIFIENYSQLNPNKWKVE